LGERVRVRESTNFPLPLGERVKGEGEIFLTKRIFFAKID